MFSRVSGLSLTDICAAYLSICLKRAFILLDRVNTITLFLFDDKRMHRLQMTPDDKGLLTRDRLPL